MNSEIARQIQAAALGPPEEALPPSDIFIKNPAPGQVLVRRYRLDEKFIAFQGHFEGRPVLPALAQTLLARDCAAAVLGRDVFIEAIIQAKFISLVDPEGTISLYARRPENESDEWRFHLRHLPASGQERDASFLRLKISRK